MPRPDDSHDPRLADFERGFRRWAERPGPPAPAWRAAGTFAPGRQRRQPIRWQVAVAGIAVATALATGLLLRWRPDGRLGAAQPPPAAAAALASRDEVLVLWLDEDTPLYLTLAPAADDAPGAERGSR